MFVQSKESLLTMNDRMCFLALVLPDLKAKENHPTLYTTFDVI